MQKCVIQCRLRDGAVSLGKRPLLKQKYFPLPPRLNMSWKSQEVSGTDPEIYFWVKEKKTV